MFLGFCTETMTLWVFVGKLVQIFKIVLPIILVVIGIVGLGKAILADDDKEIKKAVNAVIKKLIIAIVIFFIPTLVKAIFSFTTDGNQDVDLGGTDYVKCIEAIATGKAQ